MASCIRMIQSGIRLSKLRGINSASMMNSTISCRKFSSNSPNQSPIYLFDTLALVKLSHSLSHSMIRVARVYVER